MTNTLRIRIASAVLLCVGFTNPGAILAAPRALPADPMAAVRDRASIWDGALATQPLSSANSLESALEAFRSGDRDAVVRYFSSPRSGAVSSTTIATPTAATQGWTELSTTDSDSHGDGTPDYRTTVYVNYDNQRHPIRVILSEKNLDTGTEVKVLDLFEYDARGKGTSWIHEVDNGADGTVDSRATFTYEYDAQGRGIRTVEEQDTPAGGSVETVRTDTSEYDQQGHAVRHVTEISGHGSEYDVTAWSYDGKGQLVAQDQAYDQGGDGTIETRILTSLSYDQRGNVVEFLEEVDDQDDGNFDRTSRTTTEFESQSRPHQRVYEVDDGANGTIDTRLVYTYTYDAQGNEIFFLTHDVGYDRSVESTYDAQGRLVHSVSRYDEASPGGAHTASYLDLTYDARGNTLSSAYATDQDDDGVLDFRAVMVSQFNARGDITEQVSTQDFDGDGDLDERAITSSSYNNRGELAASLLKIDHGADGTFDQTVTTTIRRSRGVDAEIPVAGATQPALRLRAAGPNPFQEGSSFDFSLPAEGDAEFQIFDASGRLVRGLMSGVQTAGAHQVSWDGRDDQARRVPNGAYFARLRAAGQVTSRVLFRAR